MRKSPFKIGDVVADRYELTAELGLGGMGAVFKATDNLLGDDEIAIKLLFTQHTEDEVSMERFRQEVVLARKLSHPNIIRIYDFAHDPRGFAYITMELVDGCSYGNKIYFEKEERLRFAEHVVILRQVAEGLAHAHFRGVIHSRKILFIELSSIKFNFAVSLLIVADLPNEVYD